MFFACSFQQCDQCTDTVHRCIDVDRMQKHSSHFVWDISMSLQQLHSIKPPHILLKPNKPKSQLIQTYHNSIVFPLFPPKNPSKPKTPLTTKNILKPSHPKPTNLALTDSQAPSAPVPWPRTAAPPPPWRRPAGWRGAWWSGWALRSAARRCRAWAFAWRCRVEMVWGWLGVVGWKGKDEKVRFLVIMKYDC